MHICTPYFYPKGGKDWMLRRSALSHAIAINRYGRGRPWRNFFDSKLVGLRDHLRTVRDLHIVCVDAVDIVVVAGYPEIAEKVRAACSKTGIMFGGERAPFPLMDEKVYFDRVYGDDAKARYPCAGTIAGKRDALISAMDKIIELRSACPEISPCYNDDQGWWEFAIARGFVKADIDIRCELFGSLNRLPPRRLVIEGERILLEGSRPCFLHFNGSGFHKLLDIYKEKTGLCAQK
jgi:hypothetical protein